VAPQPTIKIKEEIPKGKPRTLPDRYPWQPKKPTIAEANERLT
jgi:hypothetical protein